MGAYPENDTGNDESGERVRVRQPGKIPGISGPDQGYADNDDGGAPDIGREMESVGFECFTSVFLCHFVESAGAGEVDG